MPEDKNQPSTPKHFQGKEALEHVIEAQAAGIVSSAEVHGTEIPGYLSAGADAARETAILLSMVWLLLTHLGNEEHIFVFLCIVSTAWLLWKAGRGAWMGWFRLERLHRVLEQERWEIEHHAKQERDELRVLYAAKGFEGKLLEDVLDVLMADNDRLLKVMVEEELGLSLGTTEHPLKQGLGAAIGALCSAILVVGFYLIWPDWGVFIGAAISITVAAALTAKLARNLEIPAVVWNVGLGILAIGCIYFLLEWHQNWNY